MVLSNNRLWSCIMYGMVFCMVWHGMVWFGMVWYGMVTMVWYGMVWTGHKLYKIITIDNTMTGKQHIIVVHNKANYCSNGASSLHLKR